MRLSAVALLGLVVSCSCAASSSNNNPSKGFPSVSFAPRGGAAASAAAAAGVPVNDVATAGSIGDPRVHLSGEFGVLIDLPLTRLRDAHEGWLPRYMSKVD